ncbi:polyprenyl synthetase family protein [Paenibacillus sp. L3-i20]|uniref:polyprenyl synthetase family protein n=1 Tax=Paenibacillus sp. L3-i20 TaxID=2905833 RepID=UPI001EDD40EA|nr:polyprenyl synthetase family protein [Paenibacillus sp. L3-i20]
MAELISNKSFQDICGESLLFKQRENTPFKEIATAHYIAFGGNSDDMHRVSTAVEQLILSLDIFDDIQDNDNEEAPWRQIDSSQAINIALWFLSSSIKQLASLEIPGALKNIQYFSNFLSTSIEGQFLDLNNQCNTEEQYLDMCAKKSGSLVAISSLIGTSMATDQNHEIVAQYASAIGIAGQIANDSNDLFCFDSKSDWRQKKKTLPIIYLLENKEMGSELIYDYLNEKISYEHFVSRKEEVINALHDSGALIYADVVKRSYEQKAIALIQTMPISVGNQDYLIDSLLKK